MDPTIGAPEVGLPAFLAGDAAFTYLNAGQIPVMKAQMPDQIRTNTVFATAYISFDLEAAPFDNPDVRRAFYYAVNRDELTSTVLKDLAIPARLDPPAGLSWVQRDDRGAGRVRSGEGQGVPRQGRLPERRRLPDDRDLVSRRRRLQRRQPSADGPVPAGSSSRTSSASR